VWGDALAAGMAKRAPELGELDVAPQIPVAMGEDLAALRDAIRPLLALYVGGMGARGKNFYNTVFQRYGYPDVAARVQDLYLDGNKAEASAALPDEFISHTNLIGPPEFVKERIAALREAGVTHLHVTPVGSDPVKLLAQVKEWISS
jgi:alkanesulfonate monooxygenase SsuD/methylene tetrahydromethanopterin reductase-like flavin-dependent oxidoreductase (luciferase family)